MTSQIGYARVSTDDQNAQLQIDALNSAGCIKVFTDTASGSLAKRPQLDKMIDQLRPDDVVVVWRLDRLGRSLKNLIALVEDLAEKEGGSAVCLSQSTRPRPTGDCSSASWVPSLCLLYTSDAADALLCVALGGRRIINKKMVA